MRFNIAINKKCGIIKALYAFRDHNKEVVKRG